MSDTPLSSAESPGNELPDESIQRRWDQYAVPDGETDLSSTHSPLALTQRSTTNASLVMSLYQASARSHVPSGDVNEFTEAASTDPVADDANVHNERGRFE